MPIIYSLQNEIKKCDEKNNTKLIDLIIKLKQVRSDNKNVDYETINNNDAYKNKKDEILAEIKSNPVEVNCPMIDSENKLTPLILAVDYPLQDPSIVQSIIATGRITDDDHANALELAKENLPKENDNDPAIPQIQEIINMLEPSQGGSKKKKTKKKKSKRRKTIKKRRL
jgi:hypothetical protein